MKFPDQLYSNVQIVQNDHQYWIKKNVQKKNKKKYVYNKIQKYDFDIFQKNLLRITKFKNMITIFFGKFVRQALWALYFIKTLDGKIWIYKYNFCVIHTYRWIRKPLNKKSIDVCLCRPFLQTNCYTMNSINHIRNHTTNVINEKWRRNRPTNIFFNGIPCTKENM